ncbi:RHS repeat domain-containing protein [Asticcacaulis sp.]|uniref:RHS repeat domain-containing protein n=1 Tax=Asticcacaulis sp. TaxID=1872648 RepID=UPI002CB55B1C|nr:RHS repeat domain-containing protein [Asticcacaulis sp.]HTM82237.1 RHS repeat domain-containing protein [Asticcacaulis sp.]
MSKVGKVGFRRRINWSKVVMCSVVVVGLCVNSSALAGNTVYQYDTLGRVVKVTYPDAKQVCYAYDFAGNRTQVKRQATGTCAVAIATVTTSQTTAVMSADAQDAQMETLSETAAAPEADVGGEPAVTTDESASGN